MIPQYKVYCLFVICYWLTGRKRWAIIFRRSNSMLRANFIAKAGDAGSPYHFRRSDTSFLSMIG